MAHPPRRKARGATLVEAMMALAVFTIGVLGLFSMNNLATGQNAVAKRQSAANGIARDLIDAFERLPYGHPYLAPATGLASDYRSAAFLDMSNADGLHLLGETLPAGNRPLLGAAEAISVSDGSQLVGNAVATQTYRVAWRTAPVLDANGTEQARAIVVMIAIHMPYGGTKQINMWGMKYSPTAVTSGTAGQEI